VNGKMSTKKLMLW